MHSTKSQLTIFDSPDLILWHARWSATRLEEHAVSIVILGPFKPKKYESLLEMIDIVLPDSWCMALVSVSLVKLVSKSREEKSPTKHEVLLPTRSSIRILAKGHCYQRRELACWAAVGSPLTIFKGFVCHL